MTIKLPRKFYVADVRAGKQLGFTDVVHSSILVGDALVLAFSPKVNELKFEGPAVRASRGACFLQFEVNETGTSLVRCHVYAPDGSRLPIYSSNVLVQNGRGTFTLPFALNDATGKYVDSCHRRRDWRRCRKNDRTQVAMLLTWTQSVPPAVAGGHAQQFDGAYGVPTRYREVVLTVSKSR